MESDSPVALSPPPSHAPITLWGAADPALVMDRATVTANVLASVIEKQRMFVVIKGRKHITVEGWTTLGAMVGVAPVCVWTRKTEDGWEARVEARRADGSLLAAAESQCDRKESTWSTRDDHALRSMAQTRATSKALATALRFIVALAGYVGTPAEEMPAESTPAPVPAPPPPPQSAPATATPPAAPAPRPTVSGQVASWPEAKEIPDDQIVGMAHVAVEALAQNRGITEAAALELASAFTPQNSKETVAAHSWDQLTKKGTPWKWARSAYGAARSLLIEG